MGWAMNVNNITSTFQGFINRQCWTLYLYWTNKKVKTKNTCMVVKTVAMFHLRYTFFQLVKCLKHGLSY